MESSNYPVCIFLELIFYLSNHFFHSLCHALNLSLPTPSHRLTHLPAHPSTQSIRPFLSTHMNYVPGTRCASFPITRSAFHWGDVCWLSATGPIGDTVGNQMALPTWNFRSHFHKESFAMPSSGGLRALPFLMCPRWNPQKLLPRPVGTHGLLHEEQNSPSD